MRSMIIKTDQKDYSGKVAGVQFDGGLAVVNEEQTGEGINRFNRTFDQLKDVFERQLVGYTVEVKGGEETPTPEPASRKKVKE